MPNIKTNAVRTLDRAGIAYELREYSIDESDLSVSLDRAAAWRPGSYGEPWREYPAEPASEQALTPYSVLALGPDDIWVAATADATPKITMPANNADRRPKRSPNAPQGRSNAASRSTYASTIH